MIYSKQSLANSPARLITVPLSIFALAVALFLPASGAVVQDAIVGDVERGRQVFERRCTGCHTLDREKEGPRLGGVFGRRVGSLSTFKYSDAVKKADVTWNEISLDKWLTDPDKLIPDNDMDFRLVKADERADVIAYLRQVSGK